MFLDKTVFVEMLDPTAADTNKEVYIAFSGFAGPGGIVSSACKMNIQPASDQMTALVDGVLGKTFKAFTNASGIDSGMRVTVSGTNQRFIVHGRQNYDYAWLKHSEVVLFKRDPQ